MDVSLHGHSATLRFANAIHNRQVWAAALPVLAELNHRGIPVIVLKSLPQVEELYGDAGGRATWDVDLVVPGFRAVDALDVMTGKGWQLYRASEFTALASIVGAERAASRLPWHVRDPRRPYEANIDLHSDGMDDWRDPPLDARIWARSVSVRRDGVEFRRLGPEDRLIYLCWHFVADGCPWQKLVDIERVLVRDIAMDWTYVAERARETGMSTIVSLVCELAAARASTSIPPAWRTALAPPAPWRLALLVRVLRPLRGELHQRETIALRIAALDSVTMLLAAAREVLLPDRVYMAAFGYGVRRTRREYFSALSDLYLSRLRSRRSERDGA